MKLDVIVFTALQNDIYTKALFSYFAAKSQSVVASSGIIVKEDKVKINKLKENVQETRL